MRNGKDILRFCRMLSGNTEDGDELYQDTMLTLSEKLKKLDAKQNVKNYALSVSIMLWKNKNKLINFKDKNAWIISNEHHLDLVFSSSSLISALTFFNSISNFFLSLKASLANFKRNGDYACFDYKFLRPF